MGYRVKREEVFDNFPQYMLGYAVEGYSEGLTDEDIANYEKFLKFKGLENALAYFDGEDEDYTGFYAHPCFGLGCECVRIHFVEMEKVK